MPDLSAPHLPSYRKHKPTGQAVVTLNGKDIYLGKHGTAESRAGYDRLVACWLANGRRLVDADESLSTKELILAFWKHAQVYYRNSDGELSSEVNNFKRIFRVLRKLWGDVPANDFSPVHLRVLRDHMASFGWVRKSINLHLSRLKHVFRWAGEQGLVKPVVYHGLLCVSGLRAGRTEAKESTPVRPVPEEHIQAVRSFVCRQVRALIDLQLLTGMRPGEACIMRACDLDMSGRSWVYHPKSHKTAHHGFQREIFLGPRAQEIVKPFLKTEWQAYLFSPGDAREDRFQILRAKRKSKVQPSQACRRRRKPAKVPGDRYTVASYRRAIAYACQRAFPLPEPLAPRLKADNKRETKKDWKSRLTPGEKEEIRAWKREHCWHPHQLRHNAATNLRRQYGVELARIILGHKTAFTTEIYAEADRQQAAEVMAKIG
jgi:integrase